MATSGGAKTTAFGDAIGALEVDRAADMVLIDWRRISYPYLDAYFSEPGRYPFLIWHKGKVAGFALIRGPVSTGLAWQVAEFYVVPDSRRLGIGREAIAAIWRRFPGAWELQVHTRNSAARQFWMSCVEGVAHETPEIREIEANDGRRLQFNFGIA